MTEAVIAILFSSLGLWGMVSYFARKWLESRLQAAEDRNKTRKEQAKERYRLNRLYMHCAGRLLFWIVHGLTRLDPEHKYFNGEVHKAFKSLEDCERQIKELDQKQLAEINKE